MRILHYLGPEGTFTHQAAMNAADALRALATDGVTLAAEPDVTAILDAVQTDGDWGVIAWENNIEGYVVPNLDALIDARNVAAFARVGVDVSFDAFVKTGDATGRAADDRIADDRAADELIEDCTTITAHPHGLAQCKRFAAAHHLKAVPAASNGAGCRDLTPGQVALGPSICGELYGLTRVATSVEDYPGAHTEFLVLAPRDDVAGLLAQLCDADTAEFESVVAFIPLYTGPGVLANLLDVLRDAGLNMTSFISRPIKGRDGTYSFIATMDAAPWQEHFRSVLTEVAEHGDWVKTLAVYPRRERPSPPVYAWSLPNGGVRLDSGNVTGTDNAWQDDDATRKELLW
ncbi:chorismate mutase [Bifidobacterium ramosum]|uniref:Prephenate dehydratase n=1 Tax=Bifidobacterium ramosum TaxID=1798158 RepID=A0A6L4X3P8_9BIFI|nr:prephenate dehydratase domain-containing protein [Bifidobacterium ramosum]KAB8289153.1 chorismate mutase [Bifidobacterium ramosum]NEG70862.1 chorismate mutase [Bifidobacterium ramosum]